MAWKSLLNSITFADTLRLLRGGQQDFNAWLGLLLGRLISDFSLNVERVMAWRVGLTASLSLVADPP